MTDKEKIKAIIKQYADKGERLLEEAYKNDECASTTGYWDGYKDCADGLLRELEDMQEEPKSFNEAIQEGDDVRYNEDLGCRVNLSRLKRVAKKETTGKLKECIDNITDESLAKARKQLQEELVNGGLDLGCGVIWKDEKSASGDLEKVVEEIVDPTVLNAYGVKEIANRLRRTMMDSVSEIDFGAEVKKLWMEINTGHSYSIVDSYNIFYGLCMDIADWQKEQQNIIEPTDDEQVKESLIFKHEDETCKENGDSLTQEPISEDLEKAAEQDVCEAVNTCSAIGIPNDHIPSWVQDAMVNEFIHGAQWKDKQLMAKAVDGAFIRRNRYTKKNVLNGFDTTCDAIQGFKDKDKIKVIFVKED